MWGFRKSILVLSASSLVVMSAACSQESDTSSESPSPAVITEEKQLLEPEPEDSVVVKIEPDPEPVQTDSVSDYDACQVIDDIGWGLYWEDDADSRDPNAFSEAAGEFRSLAPFVSSSLLAGYFNDFADATDGIASELRYREENPPEGIDLFFTTQPWDDVWGDKKLGNECAASGYEWRSE
jgi:hypothetical protein